MAYPLHLDDVHKYTLGTPAHFLINQIAENNYYFRYRYSPNWRYNLEWFYWEIRGVPKEKYLEEFY